jgi:hypothetical protein
VLESDSCRRVVPKSKRSFYGQSQVDLEVAAVITITHGLSLERWRRMGEPTAAEDDGAGSAGVALAA